LCLFKKYDIFYKNLVIGGIFMKTKVTTRGQVSIPSEIRKKLHIESETKLEWMVEGNTIRVIPIPKDPITAFRGRGKGVYTTQDLLRDRRQERRGEDDRDQRK
jgi:AbrB family looped-hinge helix DNA binding protein